VQRVATEIERSGVSATATMMKPDKTKSDVYPGNRRS
jgi:hypothetical protein